ncbi:MAG: magnesium/cobalt transporter CorA [candidate division Zixibacteria bacterium]|nr:magnesium/cobalt transporter CorA [candidate division Zixibacteria bacterium]
MLRNHRVSKKIGLKPGALIYVGSTKEGIPVTIDVMDYTATELTETPVTDVAACTQYRDPKTTTWISVTGIHDVEVIRRLGHDFGLHELVLEDVLNTAQRPKTEEWDDHIFVVAKTLTYDPATPALHTEQVSIVFGDGWVISFQEHNGDVFTPVRDRIRKTIPRVRFLGADYAAYTMLDAIVDYYFLVLEHMGERIEQIEERLIDRPEPGDLEDIYAIRRELVAMRRLVWPLREAISALNRSESKLFHDYTPAYIRDLYEHVVQVIDTLETYRETASSLLDVYLSSVSNRMNEVMKVLTIIATIFIPLSFLAGVYGMNFDTGSPFNMPELGLRYGYLAFWVMVLIVGLGLVWYFRRRRWL